MSRISRFDLTVWTVALLLVVATVLTVALAGSGEQPVRVAFLAPAYGGVPDVWMAEVDNPENIEQLTFTTSGVYDFDISPDGRTLAFAEKDSETGASDIKLLDLFTRQITQITDCAANDADCKSPIFRPDGRVLVYSRSELNTGLNTGGGLGVSRLWIADLTTNPVSNRPLFNDNQIVGHSPLWSGDGSRIAFYSSDLDNLGILIYNFNATDPEDTLRLIPSRFGAIGTLSPNGQKMVFPELVQKEDGAMYAHLRIAELDEQRFTPLTLPEDPIDDVVALWNPDGQRLAIARQYTDARYTRGHQVYLLDSETGTVSPMVVDERYNTSFFHWNQAGDKLVMQRFPLLLENGQPNNDGRPEVWTYDLNTGDLAKIYVNGYLPQWITP